MFLKFIENVAIAFLFILAFIAFEWFIGVFFASKIISFIGAGIATFGLLIACIESWVESN